MAKYEAARNDCALMGDEPWTDKMDRVGRAMWELLHAYPEVDYIRAELFLADDSDPEVLATDVAGGVLWIDEAGPNNRQVILPDGELARSGSWLEKRRPEGHEPD